MRFQYIASKIRLKSNFHLFHLDYVYNCDKQGSDNPLTQRIKNAIISRPLPFLKRGFISFHHLCGYDDSPDPGAPKNCSITLEMDPHIEEEYISSPGRTNRSLVLSVPEIRLLNDGSVASHTNWFFEYQQLPVIKRFERLVLEAEFDARKGGFGADNIHFHTPQRYANV